jgi:hypothetical protein
MNNPSKKSSRELDPLVPALDLVLVFVEVEVEVDVLATIETRKAITIILTSFIYN